MDIAAYIASRSPQEQKRLRRVNVTGRHHATRKAGSHYPPPDVMATVRYKLPTRSEVFAYSQEYGDAVKSLIPDTQVRPV